MSRIDNMIATFNNAHIANTAIKMNVHDALHGNNSNLLDLQVNSHSKFRVDIDGNLELSGSVIISGVDVSYVSGAAFDQANTATAIAIGAFVKANTGTATDTTVQAAFSKANSATVTAASAYGTANLAGALANNNTWSGTQTFSNEIVAKGGIQFNNNDELTYDDSTNTYSLSSDGSVSGTSLNLGKIRLLDTDDASLSSTTHALQIGDVSGTNLILDNNEIMSRINGAGATLYINHDGGDVKLSASGYLTTIDGDGQVSGSLTIDRIRQDGTISGSSSAATLLGASSGSPGINIYGTSTSSRIMLEFQNPAGVGGSIALSGSTTSYNTSSDERLKENFIDFDSGSILDNVKIYEYTWKSDGSIGYGPKAQELINVFPIAVTSGSIGDDVGDDSFVPWGYDSGKLIPILIKEIQQLRKRVNQLELI